MCRCEKFTGASLPGDRSGCRRVITAEAAAARLPLCRRADSRAAWPARSLLPERFRGRLPLRRRALGCERTLPDEVISGHLSLPGHAYQMSQAAAGLPVLRLACPG